MKLSLYSLLMVVMWSLHPFVSNAQNMYSESLSGVPIKVKIYSDVVGNPYLSEQWLKGIVTLENGTKSGVLDLRFDQVTNTLSFKNQNGEELNFANRVKEFTLKPFDRFTERNFKRDFPALKDVTPDDFFEVLEDGNAALLKYTKKTVIDSKVYASATVERNIDEKISYYLFIDGKLDKISATKTLPDIFKKKSDLMKSYLNENKINTKNENQLIDLVKFYNSVK